ncbi:hypothetical protein [Pseudomonas putida]|uniref:hypothetical protein n=1 Tax=Pseudomonas putida TaxID=303 RepID=UPI00236350D2|nr:hypothetical protein [Pseudomonas putida]MDD1987222.1 hypothetical protein [Pseudomonas putida]HDS1794054.1 hypothetical protein [Pseudomonas putida]
MNNQKLREQFEAAFQAEFPTTYKAAKAGEPAAHGDMTCARWGWMASREALLVCLPPRVLVRTPASREEASKDVDYLVGSSYNLAIDNCQKQIELLGIKAAD